jgi:hypothetical protein
MEAVSGEEVVEAAGGAPAGFGLGRTDAAPRLNRVATAFGGFLVLPPPSLPRPSSGGSDGLTVRTSASVNLVILVFYTFC